MCHARAEAKYAWVVDVQKVGCQRYYDGYEACKEKLASKHLKVSTSSQSASMQASQSMLPMALPQPMLVLWGP